MNARTALEVQGADVVEDARGEVLSLVESITALEEAGDIPGALAICMQLQDVLGRVGDGEGMAANGERMNRLRNSSHGEVVNSDVVRKGACLIDLDWFLGRLGPGLERQARAHLGAAEIRDLALYRNLTSFLRDKSLYPEELYLLRRIAGFLRGGGVTEGPRRTMMQNMRGHIAKRIRTLEGQSSVVKTANGIEQERKSGV